MVVCYTRICVRALGRPGVNHAAQGSSVMDAEAGEAHVHSSLQTGREEALCP